MRLLLCIILLNISLTSTGQLIPFRINKQWGYCDTNRVIKIRAQFDFADFYTNNIAFVKKDSLFYGINRLGNIITPAIKHYGTFSNNLCPVLFASGNCYYINDSGEVAINQTFDAAENFSEGLAVVAINKKLGIIDYSGNWIRKPDFDTSSLYFKSGMLLAISKGKYFYINQKGITLQLPDSIQPAGIFSEGLAPVYITKQRNTSGEKIKTTFLEFIDTSGKIILSHFTIDSLNYSEYITLEKEFIDGKAIIKTKNEIGWDYYFMDKRKRTSPLYASARHLKDSLFIGAIGYYMSDIRIVDSNYYVQGQFQQKPTQVGEFGNGLLPFRDKEGNWGYVNKNCQTIIKPKYSMAYRFNNGFAYIVYNGNVGVIDTKGIEYFFDKP
jgi:hypothetical protein